MLSLTEQFVKEAERRILTGEWKVGQKLPPLRNLAEEFHVSRSVINAGIVELCNNGYLVTIPRKYICVSDWHKSGNFAVLNGLLKNGLCDAYFFDDILEGRMTIEKAIAKKAALSRTEEDLKTLFDIVNKEKECKPIEYAELDQAFHQAVAVASHNMVYNVILNSFNSVSDKFLKMFYEKTAEREFIVSTHEKLVEKIRDKDDSSAEEVMEKLLKHGERTLKE